MNAVANQTTWTAFLKFYSEQNEGRLTRLGLFEPAGKCGIDVADADGRTTILRFETTNTGG